MKVGILTQYYPPEIGAPQARLSDLAQRLIAAGHEVHVLTAMPNYPRGKVYKGYRGLWRLEIKDGVKVTHSYIYPTKSVGFVRRLANYFSFVVSSLIIGIFVLPKLDYLITESPPLFLGMSGYLLSRLKRAKWIFNVSDLWPESAVRLGVIGDGWALRASKRLEAFCYRKAWMVTGQSHEILENILDRFPSVNGFHLSNGVDTALFSPAFRSEDKREEIALGTSCVALYAGLHGLAQGLDQVVQAAAWLKDEDLRVVFVGDGSEREALKALAASLNLKNLNFLPPVSREKMPSLQASADVALVPLKIRLPGAVPSKLYEAMGAGLPVVLVADGEAADLVNETQCGIVISPGDVEGLARALGNMARDPEARARYGANGRRAVLERFDRKAISSRFIDALERGGAC